MRAEELISRHIGDVGGFFSASASQPVYVADLLLRLRYVAQFAGYCSVGALDLLSSTPVRRHAARPSHHKTFHYLAADIGEMWRRGRICELASIR